MRFRLPSCTTSRAGKIFLRSLSGNNSSSRANMVVDPRPESIGEWRMTKVAAIPSLRILHTEMVQVANCPNLQRKRGASLNGLVASVICCCCFCFHAFMVHGNGGHVSFHSHVNDVVTPSCRMLLGYVLNNFQEPKDRTEADAKQPLDEKLF